MITRGHLLGLLCGAFVLAGCGDSTAPQGVPVTIQAGVDPSFAAAPSMTPSSIAVGDGLEISSMRIVVGEVGLGAGDQFGCIDCQGDDNETPAVPRLVDVPLDGGLVELATEMASPGTYSEVEVELAPPAAAGVADPAWPGGATLQVSGAIAATPFMLTLSIEGNSRHALAAPVTVSAQQQATAVMELRFPLDQWFTDGAIVLDPLVPADRAKIEAAILAYFQADASE